MGRTEVSPQQSVPASEFPFTVKNLKSFRGHEGEPLSQGSLYLGDERIGFFSEDGHGGPAQLDVEPAFRQFVENYIKRQPSVQFESGGVVSTMTYDDDLFVYDCIRYGDIQKKLAAGKKKGHFCYRLAGDDVFSFRYIALKPHHSLDAARTHVLAKHPDAVLL